VLPDTSAGIIEQSTTRNPVMPLTRSRASTTATVSVPILHVPREFQQIVVGACEHARTIFLGKIGLQRRRLAKSSGKAHRRERNADLHLEAAT